MIKLGSRIKLMGNNAFSSCWKYSHTQNPTNRPSDKKKGTKNLTEVHPSVVPPIHTIFPYQLWPRFPITPLPLTREAQDEETKTNSQDRCTNKIHSLEFSEPAVMLDRRAPSHG